MSQHHDHDHHGHHHSHDLPEKITKAFVISVILNLAFTSVEAVYAYLAHSASLLADAGHNFSDVLSLLIAWLGSWMLTRAPSARFSYGFKRFSIFAALINSLFLVMTSFIIGHEAIIKLFASNAMNEKIVMAVAFIGVFVNGGTALLFRHGQKSDLNLRGIFLHLAYDALISLGVVAGAIIIYFTRLWWLDSVIGMVIVLFILWGAWDVLRDSINLLLDGVPRTLNLHEIRAYLKTISGVTQVHDLHVWALSTRQNALTAHLVMQRDELTKEEFSEIRHELQHRFKIHHVTIQIECGDHLGYCQQVERC